MAFASYVARPLTSLVKGVVEVRVVQVQLVPMQTEVVECVTMQIEVTQIEMVEHMADLKSLEMVITVPMADGIAPSVVERPLCLKLL